MTSDELQEQINAVARGEQSARDTYENIWGEPFDGETVLISEISRLQADLNQPCPFCGSQNVSLSQGIRESFDQENFGVSCDDCGSSQGGCSIWREEVEYPHKSREDAWAAWNRRAFIKPNPEIADR